MSVALPLPDVVPKVRNAEPLELAVQVQAAPPLVLMSIEPAPPTAGKIPPLEERLKLQTTPAWLTFSGSPPMFNMLERPEVALLGMTLKLRVTGPEPELGDNKETQGSPVWTFQVQPAAVVRLTENGPPVAGKLAPAAESPYAQPAPAWVSTKP